MVKPKPKTVQRSKTIYLQQRRKHDFTATLRRPWDDLPPDARVSHWTISVLAGVNVRTVQRNVQRGLLPNGSTIEKAKVDQWLKAVEGTLKPGRPSMVKFRNARQRVLVLE